MTVTWESYLAMVENTANVFYDETLNYFNKTLDECGWGWSVNPQFMNITTTAFDNRFSAYLKEIEEQVKYHKAQNTLQRITDIIKINPVIKHYTAVLAIHVKPMYDSFDSIEVIVRAMCRDYTEEVAKLKA